MKEWKIDYLTHSYGVKTLFDDVSFSIQEKQRIGLIGVNGTGKTTFLKIIANRIKPDIGEITRPGEYTINYLSQKMNSILQKVFLMLFLMEIHL